MTEATVHTGKILASKKCDHQQIQRNELICEMITFSLLTIIIIMEYFHVSY